MKFKSLLILTLLSFLITFACLAKNNIPREEIKEFKSKLIVNSNGTVQVTEIITFFNNQDKLRHGFVRWLPLHYMDAHGIIHRLNYQVTKVLRNNVSLQVRLKEAGGQLQVYINDRNYQLKPGTYTFTLQYTIKDAINFFSKLDSLGWNITGNSWNYPINKVIATIQLPKGTHVMGYGGYTGTLSHPSNDFLVTQTSPNELTLQTTKPLLRRKSLYIVVNWPKGFVYKSEIVKEVPSHFRFSEYAVRIIKMILIVFGIYLVVRLASRFKKLVQKD